MSTIELVPVAVVMAIGWLVFLVVWLWRRRLQRQVAAAEAKLAELDAMEELDTRLNMWGGAPGGGLFGNLTGVEAVLDQIDDDRDARYDQQRKARHRWMWRSRLEALNPWMNRRRLHEQVRRMEGELESAERRVDNCASEVQRLRNQLRTQTPPMRVSIEVAANESPLVLEWPNGVPIPYVNGVIDLPNSLRSENRRKDITAEERRVRALFRVYEVIPWVHAVTREVSLRVRGEFETSTSAP